MSIFGIHEKALFLKTQRISVLAKNIANADTPNFKAKDIDFRKVLNNATSDALKATHLQHFEREGQINDNGEFFSVPFNPSMDGNTVEISVEQAKYGKAAAEYQASLRFIESRVSGIRRALKGE